MYLQAIIQDVQTAYLVTAISGLVVVVGSMAAGMIHMYRQMMAMNKDNREDIKEQNKELKEIIAQNTQARNEGNMAMKGLTDQIARNSTTVMELIQQAVKRR